MDTVTNRKPARALLALIVLATDLPLPRSLDINEDRGSIHMSPHTIADGLAWVEHLGGTAKPYINSDGRRYIGAMGVDWHGWQIHFNVAEDVVQDSLDADVSAALVQLAGTRP